MFSDRKRVLTYAARFCTLALVVIVIMKLSGRHIGGGIIPIFALAFVSNMIGYLLYRPK